jgi:hypothetical protein
MNETLELLGACSPMGGYNGAHHSMTFGVQE